MRIELVWALGFSCGASVMSGIWIIDTLMSRS